MTSADNRLAIYILEAGKSVKEILVQPSQKIGAMNSLYSHRGYNFIWKGQVLGKSHTFEQYGIERESVIVAIGKSEEDMKKWLRKSQDLESLRHRILTSLYPSILVEKARLLDLRQLRIDDNPKILRRYYNFPIDSQQHVAKRGTPLISEYIKPSQPVSEPISIVWK